MSKRIRDFGIEPGYLTPGPRNSISDVDGVTVGHVTFSRPREGVQTGVTAVIPRPGLIFGQSIPAAVHVANGYGKMIGLSQIDELGEIETPIAVTNTLCAPEVASGLIGWTLDRHHEARSVNPVVGEINDGRLNNIRHRIITPDHVHEALSASDKSFREGCVGAGAGSEAYGWKGGVGTASRVMEGAGNRVTVGVLTVTNLPGRFDPCAFHIPDALKAAPTGQANGSIINIVATDAPLHAKNLKRLAYRSALGIARTGSSMANGSGDYALAFSTRAMRSTTENGHQQTALFTNNQMDPLFQAAMEATEEAILNAMAAATTTETSVGRLDAFPFKDVVAR